MAEKKNKSYFWASYADLMTSLFFVMLMLFVVAVVQLNKEKKEVIGVNEKLQEMLNKAQEIEDATKGLDEDYFEYKENFKKHKLKIDEVRTQQTVSLESVHRQDGVRRRRGSGPERP